MKIPMQALRGFDDTEIGRVRRGQRFGATPTRADRLISGKLAVSLVKRRNDHSPAAQPGKSSTAGEVQPSSASPVVPVSPQTTAHSSDDGKRKRRKRGASSSATPASDSPCSQTLFTPATHPGGGST